MCSTAAALTACIQSLLAEVGEVPKLQPKASCSLGNKLAAGHTASSEEGTHPRALQLLAVAKGSHVQAT